MSRVAGVATIRAAFPALARREGGRAVAYFDGPGGTQVPRPVIDAVGEYLAAHNANTHWAYPSSAETDAMLERARQRFAAFFAGAPDEVAFGSNMTTITFHLARALARGWRAGDEVIVTELDHHGNVAPWQAIARERGVVLRWIPLDPVSGELELDRLEGLLTDRTRLVAVGAASNLLGTITDVARVAAAAHRAGALVFVDAVHYAPHRLPDVAALDCDFLACSAYKFYGPHVGVLWCRRDLGLRLDVPRLEPAPDTMPERLETGTQNHEGIAGAAAAIEWLASLAPGTASLRDALTATYDELHRRGSALFARLWEGLGEIPSVTRYGPPPGALRTATAAFTVGGRSSEAVAVALAAEGCFVSHGDFYAATAVDRIGCRADGVVRIGAACYTTAEEIDRVLAGVARVARGPAISPGAAQPA